MELKSFSDLKEKKCRLSVLWEILCKIKSKSGRAVPFPNDLLFIANNGYKDISALYYASSDKAALAGLCYVHPLQKGYLFAGYCENEIGLFSPKGNLSKIFIYDKKLFSECYEYSQEGVKYCRTGFSLFTKFAFKYDTVALKCADRCYIAKVTKFDPKTSVFVGKYDDILEMKDSVDGKVVITYKDGKVKMWDKNLKEIKLEFSPSKITFLENGCFIAYHLSKGAMIFDKTGKLIKKHNLISASEYSRFYKIHNGRLYDCYTHDEYDLKKVPLLKNKSIEVFYEKNKVYCFKIVAGKRTKRFVLIENCPSVPRVIDEKYLYFDDNKWTFVIDPLASREETVETIANYLIDHDSYTDISDDMFLYLKTLCEYLYGKSNSLRVMLFSFVHNL